MTTMTAQNRRHAIKTSNQGCKMSGALVVLALAILMSSNSLLTCQAAIFSMADPSQPVALHHPKLLMGWEEFLKMRPIYGDAAGDGQEFILVDTKVGGGIPSNKFGDGAKNPAKRGDEKRRDFEHGWEQCEFSPISCMLKRRRR